VISCKLCNLLRKKLALLRFDGGRPLNYPKEESRIRIRSSIGKIANECPLGAAPDNGRDGFLTDPPKGAM